MIGSNDQEKVTTPESEKKLLKIDRFLHQRTYSETFRQLSGVANEQCHA